MRYEQAARSLSEYDEIDPAARLLMEEVREIRQLVVEGKSVPQPPFLRRDTR